MNISDYDIFSSKPKQHINELYKQFIKEPYVWSASCSFAKNHGTCTLYINEKKIADITYMNQQTIDMHSFIQLSNIRCLPYVMQMSSLISLLSDIESVYMIPKTVDKLRLLNSQYPFRFDNKILSESNILEYDLTAKLVSRISSSFNRFKQSDFIKIPKLFDLKEGRIYIENDEIKHSDTSVKFNEYDNNASELESIHPITGFPSFRRYTQPSLHRYFFTGSIAAFLYISAFGDNIQIGNTHIPKNLLVSSIFENDIELYVENIDVVLTLLLKEFKHINIAPMNLTEYPCMFSKSIKVTIDKYANSIILYELTHERFIEKTNLKLANMTINGVYCSSYIFLLSHILFKLVLYGKSDYIKYSNLICILSNIASKHSYHSIFKPSHFSSKYTAGNKKSIYKSNDSIIDSITKSSEPKKIKDYKIVINYETS
jgi:hypothetical protein